VTWALVFNAFGVEHRASLPFAATGLAIVLCASGCQLFRSQGPVSKPVAEARELSQRGMNAMERGDLPGAESLLAQAVKVCPSDIEARRQYAEMLWQRGQREVALSNMEKAQAMAPDDPQIGCRVGEMYLALGKLDDARQTADDVLDLTPGESRAWALRGRADEAAGNFDRALADFHRALEDVHDDRELLIETAELYRRMNRPQRALSTLTALCETYGPGEEPQQVLYLKGLALAALSRHDEAADAFALALEHGSASPELLYRLGESALAAGRTGEAERAVLQALAMEPGHEPSRALKGRIDVAMGRVQGSGFRVQ
jgi:tetratricopeptide (TPR) repeat protein